MVKGGEAWRARAERSADRRSSTLSGREHVDRSVPAAFVAPFDEREALGCLSLVSLLDKPRVASCSWSGRGSGVPLIISALWSERYLWPECAFHVRSEPYQVSGG